MIFRSLSTECRRPWVQLPSGIQIFLFFVPVHDKLNTVTFYNMTNLNIIDNISHIIFLRLVPFSNGEMSIKGGACFPTDLEITVKTK